MASAFVWGMALRKWQLVDQAASWAFAGGNREILVYFPLGFSMRALPYF
jgi:hypothetical protein